MRKLIILSLAAALAACSGSKTAPAPADNGAAADLPAPGATATPAADADAADTHTTPEPSELGVFKNWTVGCDNGLTCQAVAVAPEDGDVPDTLMSIMREGGPDGAFTVWIDGSKLPGLPVIVAVDGKPVAHGGTLNDDKSTITFTGADARAIALGAANGQAITLQGSDGYQPQVSLSGLSAALRYIDAKQGLAGTTSAMVARGDGQASTPAPALPVIRAVSGNGDVTKLSAAQIKALRDANECPIAEYMSDPPGADYAALDGGKTLMLMPCDSGAYNLIALAFIIGKDGKAELAKFDAGTSFNDEGAAAQLVNAAYDGRTLSTFAKSRGLGDCGIAQSFVWDGAMFRLAEQSEMGECRGSTDYITTWRARVVR
jgi:hypothetical protein